MSKRMKALLMGIIAVVVVAVLIFAYFASQPEVKWWMPEKELKKPDVDLSKLNDTIEFVRGNEDMGPLGLVGGNESYSAGFHIGVVLSIKWYTYYKDDYDEMRGNLTAWAERVSGDYILQKLVIEYSYGSKIEDIYTQVEYMSLEEFWSTNLWYDASPAPGMNKVYYDWDYNHRVEGINRDAVDKDFYGVGFPMEIKLFDSLSKNLTHTITFTVTAYYGHPSLLGWTDMDEVKTQVVLKIVPGGE